MYSAEDKKLNIQLIASPSKTGGIQIILNKKSPKADIQFSKRGPNNFKSFCDELKKTLNRNEVNNYKKKKEYWKIVWEERFEDIKEFYAHIKIQDRRPPKLMYESRGVSKFSPKEKQLINKSGLGLSFSIGYPRKNTKGKKVFSEANFTHADFLKFRKFCLDSVKILQRKKFL